MVMILKALNISEFVEQQKKRHRRYKYMPMEKVTEIELNTKHVKLRLILLIVAIVIAIIAFSVGILLYTKEDNGFQEIIPNDYSSIAAYSDYSFYYYLDSSDGTKIATKR